MRIDGGLMGDLTESGRQAKRLEGLGYNGVLTAETAHDPFFPLLLAAQETESIELMTSIAVAFSRTPMNLANIGHDLNSFSKGRFILGLGSQIRPHITKRFSMPWSKPAARMRVHSCHASDLAILARGRPTQIRRGVLYTLADDADVYSDRHRLWRSEGLSCSRRSTDDRGCRRGSRRSDYSRVYDREIFA